MTKSKNKILKEKRIIALDKVLRENKLIVTKKMDKAIDKSIKRIVKKTKQKSSSNKIITKSKNK